MNASATPIAATTALSILLHGLVIAAVLLAYEQVATTGRGIDIQLISSTMVADQQETQAAHHNNSVENQGQQKTKKTLKEKQLARVKNKQHEKSPAVLASPDSMLMVPASVEKDVSVEQQNLEPGEKHSQQTTNETQRVNQVLLSTNAVQQQHSMLELLHASISDNKEYPYIARRQRREGTATVSFVLHPDGSIENAQLVNSSRTKILDRAAVSAVKKIEPFKPAQEHLESTEEFKVNVVFNLQ